MIDYLIVGQGIAGTLLQFQLSKENKSFRVVDSSYFVKSSSVAAGIMNPVTGRRLVTSWRAETLFPVASKTYQSLGAMLRSNYITAKSIVAIPQSIQMQNEYERRINDMQYTMLCRCTKDNLLHRIQTSFGMYQIQPAYSIAVQRLLADWKSYLQEQQLIIATEFDFSKLQLIDRHSVYYDGVPFQKVIFCEGIQGQYNPFWQHLPFKPNKGEAIILEFGNDIDKQYIYKFGGTTLTFYNHPNLWWAGSSYELENLALTPSESFKQKKLEEITSHIKDSFELVNHLVGIRPTTIDRRPFLGLHKKYPQIGIMNGLGTKGVSLAPWLAIIFCDFLHRNKPIPDTISAHRAF
ncbi:MAG: FAD-dependent oxidoreductase [Phycisphaerales bacterium]|nr:FAD-dependent oxidoreductase [Phycisphaerales bacterium]